MGKQMKRTKPTEKGFTLIEVVLVLAIGGLIFLLAFLAFRQVSANRRDTQRRADAGRVIAELQNYYADKGSYPANFTYAFNSEDTIPGPDNAQFMGFVNSYLGGSKFAGPGSVSYTWIGSLTAAAFPALAPSMGPGAGAELAAYALNKRCEGTAFSSTSYPGSVAVLIALERGTICRDSR